jgi:DNA replication and repair protein RecF
VLLRRINLLNYKNYGTTSVLFEHKFNLINGLNGSGKTNLIDSLHYLCLCKSYFTRSDLNVVKHGAPYFRVDGYFETTAGEMQITCKVTGLSGQGSGGVKKEFFRNNEQYERLSDHIGLIPVVMIAPGDIDIINEGSEERRRFLDTAISQVNNEYLTRLMHYNRLLMQRNALLKQYVQTGHLDNTLIEVLNNQLAVDGDFIHAERKQYLLQFGKVFGEHYHLISGQNEVGAVVYLSQAHEKSHLELFKQSVYEDMAAGRTTNGIHKDDLKLTVNDYAVRETGSQGQIKSFLIAMKITQCLLMEQLKGKKSIMLLDDVFEKLDKQRLETMFRIFASPTFDQVFITDADEKRSGEFCAQQFEQFGHFRVFDNLIDNFKA